MMSLYFSGYTPKNIWLRSLSRGLLSVCCIGLVACSTTTSTTTSTSTTHDNRTAWQKSKDSAPAQRIDVSNLKDAQPKPVVRTRAGNKPVYTVLGKTYRVLPDSKGYRERGYASWYGTKFHGRRTANGEIYDMHAMTAAHKTLPIPSYVRVTHVGNGRSIVVRVNDRGPFHGDRIIDLSYAAAIKLGYDKQGVALVDVVDVTPTNSDVQANTLQATAPTVVAAAANKASVVVDASRIGAAGVYLQLGAFQKAVAAEKVLAKVQPLLPQNAPIGIFMGDDQWHRVRIGPIHDVQNIASIRQRLSQQGYSDTHIIYLQ